MKLPKKELVFAGKFLAIFSALQFIVFTSDFSSAQAFIASTHAAILDLEHYGNLIFVKDGVFAIVPLCTGIVSASILGAIIFSLRKPGIGEKALIFAAGAIILAALNYFRVLMVIWAGREYGIAIAEWLHILTWVLTTAFIIGVWFAATKKITGIKSFEGFL